MKNEAYINALEAIASQSRLSIGLFAIPLGIILAQLRYISQIDSILLSMVTTSALLFLFWGVCVAWWAWILIHSFYIKELYLSDGEQKAEGRLYLAWFEEKMFSANIELTEKWLVDFSERIQRPILIAVMGGYTSLFALLLLVVWSAPQ